MHVVTESDFWTAVKNGACPFTILKLFDYVMDNNGYFINSDYFLKLPEKRAKLLKIRPDLEGKI